MRHSQTMEGMTHDPHALRQAQEWADEQPTSLLIEEIAVHPRSYKAAAARRELDLRIPRRRT